MELTIKQLVDDGAPDIRIRQEIVSMRRAWSFDEQKIAFLDALEKTYTASDRTEETDNERLIRQFWEHAHLTSLIRFKNTLGLSGLICDWLEAEIDEMRLLIDGGR